jgi:translation initiation factor IF-2
MVKKDEIGPDIRAGSDQEEITPAVKKGHKPHAEPSVEQHAPVHPGEMTAHAQDQAHGPTITMQGVSGKKITGVVKVVKVSKADAAAPAAVASDAAKVEPAPAAVASAVPPVAADPVPAKPANVPVASDTAAPAPAASVPAAPATLAAPVAETAKPAAAPAPAAIPAVAEDQAAPVQKTTEPAAPATADAAKNEPAKTAPDKPGTQGYQPTNPYGTPNRPQSGNYNRDRVPGSGNSYNAGYQPSGQYGTPNRPQSGNYSRDRVQGSGNNFNAGYGNRPQGAPGQDGYGNRPQGAPGQDGYGNRPQGGPGQGGYGNRPQGGPGQGGYGSRPQGAPGQGGYGNRPQGGPGQGGYGNRPQGAPGQGGYGNRPQGGPGQGGYGSRPSGGPGQGGYGSRPQGGFGGGFDKDKDRPAGPAYGNRPSGPAKPRSTVPAELQGKESGARPRNDFGKEPKRDDRSGPKKDTTKSVQDVRDKHNVLRQQAAVVSGKGINDALNDPSVLDTLYTDSVKGKRGRNNRRAAEVQPRAVLTQVSLPENLTVKEFSEAIKKTTAEVIKKLIKYGIMATVNQVVDFDTASLIADEFGIKCEKLVEVTEEEILFDDSEDQEKDLKPRPPVVVVMGHVDHGKTSILDRIRSANVVAGEAGGITQHIGAYTVRAKGRQITFLDTPGHEAFTTMRARGAQVTDIAILVVAADDGVMPQTIEAINHAKAANTQIIVAINKIDKEGANIDKVKQELSIHELIPEEWGGTTVMVPVSAKVGTGMDELLEMVLLTADLLDLKADPDKQAKGTVIEAKLDKNRGPVATVLVQRGTLRTGDTVVTGSIIGNVRAMSDDKGNLVKKAGPSIPVEILGLPEVPEAGEIFYAVTDDKVARTLAEKRRIQQREKQLRTSSHVSLDTLFSKLAAGEVKDLNIIVKADVQGSVEAVRQSLEKIGNEEVRVNVIHGAVGAITETDIRLAEVSNAIVIGFNVRPAANVADLAKETDVDIRLYRVIYNAIEDVEAAMKGMLTPKFKENILGHAEVRLVYKVTGVGTIAGSYVIDGKIVRSSEVRIVRDGIVIHEGKLASLRRFKDDVREVATGYECGIGIERFNDIKEGDVLESFEMQEIERS